MIEMDGPDPLVGFDPFADRRVVEPFGSAPPPNFDMTDGRCRDYPQHASAFFASTTSSTNLARSVCDGCPIIEPCREYAELNPSVDGVWGGTSHAERNKKRYGQPLPRRGLNVTDFTDGQGGRRFVARYLGYAQLENGKPMSVARGTKVAALAALMKLADGIPTAQRDIQIALRDELRERKRTMAPLPTRTNVDKQPDPEPYDMPKDLQNIYTNWSE